ncbi:MAG TPA: YetF domain-containing protein [Ignavibacteriales bacterium]|nr:YetF domain-containing protein [Ignavibacteriales bacterium]
MDSVIRGLAIYFFLLIIFRVSGKRTLAQITTFDLALLLIISETTQQAMIDSDNSIINGLILITTLVGASIGLSFLKGKMSRLEKWIDGLPLIIMKDGKPDEERLKKSRVDEKDIMYAARQQHGLKTLDEVDYAVLEKSGEISIIPKKEE